VSTARDFAVVQDVVHDGDALLRTARPISTSFLQRSAAWFARENMRTFSRSLWALGPAFGGALMGCAVSMIVDPSGRAAMVVAPSIFGAVAALIPASQVTRKLAEAQCRKAPLVSAEAFQPALEKFETATGVEKAARGKVLSNLLVRLDAEGALDRTALDALRDARNATLGLPAADVERSAELMTLATRLHGIKTVSESDYDAVRKLTETLPAREAGELTTEIVDYLRERKAVDATWFGWLETLGAQYVKRAAEITAAERAAAEQPSGDAADDIPAG
jgi:hypothetical protein